MTEREEMLAQVAQLRHAYMHLASGSVKRQKEFADGLIAPVISYLEKASAALRSAARTGPDVAGFEAGRNAARMAALAQRCERGTTWDLACTTIAAAIAALPAPAGESVTVKELADAIATASLTLPGDDHAARVARNLLSTFTITRKSEARS